MFYCDVCAERKKWPIGLVRSHGPCEVCGRRAECSDVRSSDLPAPSKRQVEVPPQNENPDYEAYFKD